MKSWINRVVNGNEDAEIKSIDDFKKALTEFTVPPTIEEDKDFYADYGSDDNYHTRTGKGECAA